MKTHKYPIKKFSSKVIDVIEDMIGEFDIENAQNMLKRLLTNTNYDNKTKSDFYVLLGRIKYLIGHMLAAKRYYNLAIRLNPKNYDAFYNLTYVYMYENNVQSAKKLIAINLKENPNNVNVLIQHIWCILFESSFEDAKYIYQRLVAENKIGDQGFADLAIGCLSKGDFYNSKKVIGMARSLYPENYIIEDTYYEIIEAEKNFDNYKMEIFFKRLDKIHFMTDVYSSALRLFVEGAALRDYLKPYVEKGADFIIFLNDKRYEIHNAGLLASAVEFTISRCFGDERYIKHILTNRYKLAYKTLIKTVHEINEVGLMHNFDFEGQIMQNIWLLGDEFDPSEEDFDDDE